MIAELLLCKIYHLVWRVLGREAAEMEGRVNIREELWGGGFL
jgi:hypothetical protein